MRSEASGLSLKRLREAEVIGKPKMDLGVVCQEIEQSEAVEV